MCVCVWGGVERKGNKDGWIKVERGGIKQCFTEVDRGPKDH